jgi:hypothetical protein
MRTIFRGVALAGDAAIEFDNARCIEDGLIKFDGLIVEALGKSLQDGPY